MKKLFAYLAVFGMMSFGSVAMAQDENAAADATEQVAPGGSRGGLHDWLAIGELCRIAVCLRGSESPSVCLVC